MSDLPRLATQVRRRLLRHRRLLTALLAAAATAALVQAVAAPAAPTAPVVVASRDLGGGSVIGPDDVHVVETQPDLVPDGSATSPEQVVGETVAGPMRAGEIFTDRRVVAPSLVDGYGEGLLATPVRLQDADIVGLLQVGDRVDVYAATGDPESAAHLVLSSAAVVAVPRRDESAHDGALIVLALTSAETARLAQASATTQLSVSLRG